MKTISYYIQHPNEFIGGVIVKLSRLFPNDEWYLKILFRCFMKRKLDLKNPRTFSEKLQWLKLYNRRPEYTMMVDKCEVKKYVSSIIGEEYVIPTLGVWDSVEDIDINTLPNQFVLKTTHAGGGNGVVICKDKNTFDFEKAKKKLARSMKTCPYKTLREWPYKYVKHRIIAEKFLSDKTQNDIPDYKFFCFHGEPQFCQVISGRTSDVITIDWYNKEWEHQAFHEPRNYPFANIDLEKPVRLNDMWKLASELSKGHPFLRVDFYSVNNQIYFGELTFFPTSGIGGFNPDEWDYTFGSWIKLPNK